MIKKLLTVLSPKEKKNFIKLIFVLIFTVILEMLSVGIILPTLSIILDTNKSFSYLEDLDLNFLSFLSKDNLIYFTLFFLSFIFIFKNIIIFFSLKYQAKVLATYNENLVNSIYRKYLGQPLKILMSYNTSFLSRNIIEITNIFSNNLLQSILSVITESFLLIGILIILFINQFYLTLFSIVIILPVAFIIYNSNKKKLIFLGEQSKFHWGERLKKIQETFGGVLEVKTFGKQDQFFNKFKFHNNKLKDITIKLSVINIIPRLIFEILIILIICLGIVYFSFNNFNIINILPTLGLFVYAFLRLIPVTNKLLVSFQRIKYSSSILDEIHFIKIELISEKQNSKKKIFFNKKISINNLSYSYDSSQNLFSNLNIEIKKNSLVGIYGKSGSGKSTLLKILLGLIKPTYGNILSDGEDISNHISSWQQITGFVPQNVYIMDDTLENNISMLGEKNKINQNKIYEIINKVNLVDFLNHLPKKENTILGEVGQRISGGQKQRIGIARAIYSDPQILILDESTSNLDNDTENQILRELKMLTKNLTIIIVSHRENIKNYCDTVYTLENQNIKKIK